MRPILEMSTAYGANKKFDVYPRKFFYQKGSKLSETFSGPEMEAVSAALTTHENVSLTAPFLLQGTTGHHTPCMTSPAAILLL